MTPSTHQKSDMRTNLAYAVTRRQLSVDGFAYGLDNVYITNAVVLTQYIFFNIYSQTHALAKGDLRCRKRGGDGIGRIL